MRSSEWGRENARGAPGEPSRAVPSFRVCGKLQVQRCSTEIKNFKGAPAHQAAAGLPTHKAGARGGAGEPFPAPLEKLKLMK